MSLAPHARQIRTLVIGFIFSIAFVGLPITGLCGQADARLVLTSSALGPLPLGKGTLVSESYLKKLFPHYSITHQIGSGDSPDFHYFEIIDKNGELLFTIKSFIEDENQQGQPPTGVHNDLLQVRSPRIKDIYGLRVGDRVKDIIKTRGKDLHFGAGHHDVYLGTGKIYYNMRTNSDWSPERLSLDDAMRGNWQVVSISWPEGAWE